MREVDLARFADAHREGAVVIDVRELFEYVAGHVPDARLVPMNRLEDHVAEFSGGEPVFLICTTGRRSREAADLLVGCGVDAWSVAGGTGAWTRAGHPVVRGAPTPN